MSARPNAEAVTQLIRSREGLPAPVPFSRRKVEAEGGCGVVGLAATVPVLGRHILAPCRQMHNRGNGKGGGLAAAGLLPEQMGVDADRLATDYLVQIAYLTPELRRDIEAAFIDPVFDLHAGYRIPTVDDHRDVPGLTVRPPDVWRYFARVREDVLAQFIETHRLDAVSVQAAEDEYVSQWAFRLNTRFYAGGPPPGPPSGPGASGRHAFVLSYGRDMLVLKIVGYAEDALHYYRMEDVRARIWIGHQRYPTKGRVWHPGGAHPFAALDVALVHNGDFANYHAVCEYLAQRNLFPLFLTDTEVAVLLFDLWSRTYGYPTEYLIEAMAPTTERDFLLLPEEKRTVYRAIQASHIHGSPDGPWFFIIGRSLIEQGRVGGWQLLGITDTSMLRPQVFALQEGEVSVGIIASEKQAIDATLASLSHEDARICPLADRYWNARGGSYTDGGAFLFTVRPEGTLTCSNKFGAVVRTPPGQRHRLPLLRVASVASPPAGSGAGRAAAAVRTSPPVHLTTPEAVYAQGVRLFRSADYETIERWLSAVRAEARGGGSVRAVALEGLTRLLDGRWPTGAKKRASLLAVLHAAVYGLLRDVPPINGAAPMVRIGRSDWAMLSAPQRPDQTLVIDARGFPMEGEQGLSRALVRAYALGWRTLIVFDVHGQRFIGSGFGPRTGDVRLEIYGSSGDYLGSGLDGMTLTVHGDAQDQVGQILKAGKLVIHGSVGQTFLYGAKGGEIYVLGSAAGRPLINAVGRPRVVINGTALDYLAESFMAGDPLEGGGFCILNGVTFDHDGRIVDLDTPYPGGNLFSLASGGAIYARDPYRRLDEDQLNGGRFADLTAADWNLIRPYLEENERLFAIPVERLLTVDGHVRSPEDVYRKVEPVELGVLKG
ncbi:MAG: glutamate synthase [Armatimonadota bacterium]|nr:glutamate synthase [Armatimonadota bacterium]MDR7451682.1 glutamate synthase [Armatimonadota bacterium]MDR7465700.1 glutamate synthase [Armatimonadota bacterium]MDR7493609.1 glutamate synthase [Armatimonadota bacterium]MDR7499487.1 glutamate synthase [Armatimonadota bacterium]